MDMKVSSDEIRSYVSAQAKIAKQELPEESRRLVLRLPADSVNISPQARALQKGSLRVAMEENGRFIEVTDDSSNPVLKLLDEGMSDVKQHLDKMKKLTELMEDEELAAEDRYAAQIKLVELEGELDKTIYALHEEYAKLAKEQGLPMVPGMYELAKGEVDPGEMFLAAEFAQPVSVEGLMVGVNGAWDAMPVKTKSMMNATRCGWLQIITTNRAMNQSLHTPRLHAGLVYQFATGCDALCAGRNAN